MPVSQDHVSASTPMGANLVADGATFRVWAPGATHVYVVVGGADHYHPDPADELVKDAAGHWTGFRAGVSDGTRYRFYVMGPGGQSFKRDPWARELEGDDYAQRDGIVRDPTAYPWHDGGFRAPVARDLIVYQFHIGVFYARDRKGQDLRGGGRVGKLLDAVQRVPYLADLGVTAVQALPFEEFQTPWSLGYNGTDIFSPETDYCVPAAELGPYVDAVNALLAAKGCAPLDLAQLNSHVAQLKAFVDICHLHGIAVLADVVYNHVGGELDAQSLDHFDWDLHRDLYFSGPSPGTGGRLYNYDESAVRDYLIDNAQMLLGEYHVDGLRCDEVTVITRNGGTAFCQDLTRTIDYARPAAPKIAEFWGDPAYAVRPVDQGGLGFDLCYSDRLRIAIRDVIAAAAGGANATVELGGVRDALYRPWGVAIASQVYNCVENHDLIYDGEGDGHRQPRIPSLADRGNPRSWYAASRSRVATGLLLTAPGVPMLFMGQEFLTTHLWSDAPNRPDLLISWDGEEGADPAMHDHHTFTRDLIWLRRRHPALRDDPVTAYEPDAHNRVLAFHRWVPAIGRDVVIVATLSESTLYGYELGLPQPGDWLEAFNSDFYERFPNPWVQGNGGAVTADGRPRHGMAQSARLTIPANSLLAFTRDRGD